MTPLMLEMLLHYHYSVDDFPRLDFGAQQEAIRFLLANELLEHRMEPNRYKSSYEVTERGMVFIKALLSLPLPEKTSVIPEWRHMAE